MSFEIDRGGWTEDELAAGVHILASGLVRPENDDDDDYWDCGASNWEALFDEAGAELLIGALFTPAEVRARISQYVLEGERELIIKRYAHRERLPAEFTSAAGRSDAIPILIKSFLRKVLRVFPRQDLANEILALSSELHHNCEKKTVFDRVGVIQAYIHRKADETNGAGAHLDLPNGIIRHVLSSCRLHLSIQDMFGQSITYWSVVWDAEVARSQEEAANPKAGFIPVGKRRTKYWRVPQMKPLTHFSSRKCRGILNELAKLPLQMPVEEYRRCALQALHADPEAARPKQPKWQAIAGRGALSGPASPPLWSDGGDIPF